jgi:NAD(P)H-flavin reductase
MMGKTFGAENLGHPWKVQVAGDRGGTPLVAMAKDLKEHSRAGPGQRHECPDQ